MERLTYFEGGRWWVKILDTEHSGPVADRLAAYEDTGMEPEEIKTMHNEQCLKCGKYKDAHLGACNGCRWKKEMD